MNAVTLERFWGDRRLSVDVVSEPKDLSEWGIASVRPIPGGFLLDGRRLTHGEWTRFRRGPLTCVARAVVLAPPLRRARLDGAPWIFVLVLATLLGALPAFALVAANVEEVEPRIVLRTYCGPPRRLAAFIAPPPGRRYGPIIVARPRFAFMGGGHGGGIRPMPNEPYLEHMRKLIVENDLFLRRCYDVNLGFWAPGPVKLNLMTDRSGSPKNLSVVGAATPPITAFASCLLATMRGWSFGALGYEGTFTLIVDPTRPAVTVSR